MATIVPQPTAELPASEPAARLQPGLAVSRTGRRRQIHPREIVAISSQLAIMTRSGVEVAGALQSLARQCRNPHLRRVLENVHEGVIGGKSFSAALAEHEDIFGGAYVASVAAGEASGKMALVLAQLAALQRSDLRLRGTIRTLLAYPVMLMLVSGLVIVSLVLFVLPQFADIFDQYDTPLPAITRVLLAIATEVQTRFWLWGTLALAGVLALAAGFLSERGREIRDSLLLNSPLLREVSRSLLIGRACRSLGLMIDSGVPLLESLGLARKSISNRLYRRLFDRLADDVMNGRGLANALLETNFVPPSAAEMLVTAERTGNLGSVTQLIGEHFEEEAESRLREIVTVLEPVITVGMGAIVAVVVLAVMMPMFDLATFAGG